MINEHPLEKVFGIEPGSTFDTTGQFLSGTDPSQMSEREVAILDPTTGELITRSNSPDSEQLDREERLEDLHIDGQLETVHAAAMDAFQKQIRMSEEVDPKFAARNAEVAAQYLNIALNAVGTRIDSKFKRQKIKIAKKASNIEIPSITNNIAIIGNRDDILKNILGATNSIMLEEKK